MNHQCPKCKGLSEIVKNGIKQLCTFCEGLGFIGWVDPADE